MPSLPVCVRLACWATAALRGALPLDDAVRAATPDLDAVRGLAECLAIWRDLGEGVVLPALPTSGDLGMLPRGNVDLVAAAVASGEAIYVPGIGAALVPHLEQYGPDGDRGWSLRHETFDCDPVPRHRLECLSIREVDRDLREALTDATTTLARLSAVWGEGRRELADAALGGDWGLPDLPAATAPVLTRAATLAVIATTAEQTPDPSLTSSDADTRERTLRALHRAADRALEQSTTVACLQLAGWLPAR